MTASAPGGPATTSGARGGLRRRLFAFVYEHAAGRHERLVAERKRALLAGLAGDVLEVGAGTGANLAHYAPGVRLVAVEPNVHMQAYLRERARERGIPIDVRSGLGERLPFEDASFDAVVATLVLCSADDPAAALRELRRVLRPGGRYVFLEHVAAPRGTALRRLQRCCRPFTSVLLDGCRPDRETGEAILGAGFASVGIERFDVALPLVSPHVAGVAVR